MNTRLLVSAPLSNGSVIDVDGDQARYLGRVLRARVGDTLQVFNGDDGEYRATVQRIEKSRVELIVGEPRQNLSESPLRIHLVQAVSRGDRMDTVVQKATELGVKRITPVLSNHGMVKLDAKRGQRRREHWIGIANSATEQSGRLRPPLIDAPIDLNHWFGQGSATDSRQFVLHPYSSTRLVDAEPPLKKLCLLIGPEGGFSEREYDDAALAGFAPVALGPRILRTETAAIAAVAVAQSRWGDL